MADWPITLPTEFLDGAARFKDSEPDNLVTYEQDPYTTQIRRRSVSALREFSGDMYITQTQKAILRTFYRANCAIPFNFTDPETRTTIEVVFLEPPQYQPHGRHQRVSLKLGKLP